MVSNPDEIFTRLAKATKEPETATPDMGALVGQIYGQAKTHRDQLIRFYIWYTCILSGLVMGLIFVQAGARLMISGDETIELIPQWALNLIVIGMFGQFIGLLTIVTQKVWDFGPFLAHAKNNVPKQPSV
jgi:hypothetical protein